MWLHDNPAQIGQYNAFELIYLMVGIAAVYSLTLLDRPLTWHRHLAHKPAPTPAK